MKNPNPLPPSNDEFWDGDKLSCTPTPIHICPTHTKETWMTHKGYQYDSNGCIVCKFCSWGTRVPGYYRLVNGVVVDLRTLNKG